MRSPVSRSMYRHKSHIRHLRKTKTCAGRKLMRELYMIAWKDGPLSMEEKRRLRVLRGRMSM